MQESGARPELLPDSRFLIPWTNLPPPQPVLPKLVVQRRPVFSATRFDDEAKNIAMLERASSAMAWPIVVGGVRHR